MGKELEGIETLKRETILKHIIIVVNKANK